MLTKTFLNVAYKDKEDVKSLGAKWDPEQKTWYIPPGKDPKIFKKWLIANANKPELTITDIGLVRSLVSCWSCKGYCTVYAIYTRNIELAADQSTQSGFFVLTEIAKIPENLADFLILRCPNFRIGKADLKGIRTYRNHCDHCKIGLSDLRMHKKGQGFNPSNIAACRTMQFIDLGFFNNLKLMSDFIDYTNNDFFKDKINQADYLTDFI